MSDLWSWVDAAGTRLREGDAAQQRLAELLRALPSATVDDDHARVDLIVPEALALARSLDEPWLELFIRHWNLQSRVLHRCQAGDELREAVELLEFASRDETRGCPQSVCVVQDLACCYSISDGPGYVDERLAVARETLGRIDPSWPCFDCISAEYFSALIDDQRPQQALDFVEAQRKALAEHGIFTLGSNLILDRARALLALGRGDEALAVIDGMHDVARFGDSYVMHHRNLRVSALLALGRDDEALALHPPLSAIIATPSHYENWIDNLAVFVDRGHIDNGWQIGAALLDLQRRLQDNQARGDAAHAALIGLRLALDRGAAGIARLLLADLRRLQGLLRKPGRNAAAIATAEARLAGLAPVVDPALDADEQRARLQAILDDPEGVPMEQALDLLDAAISLEPEGPARGGWRRQRARVLRELGRTTEAVAGLQALLAQTPADADSDRPGEREQIIRELALALLADDDLERFDALFAALVEDAAAPPLHPDTHGELLWLRGEALSARGQLEAAIENDRRLLALVPEAHAVRLRLAATHRARGDWRAALAELDRAVVELELEPGPADWDRITAATVLGAWATVHESAARLGLSLPEVDDPHAPIEIGPEHGFGLIRCEFIEANGERQRYWARRTSPCGARIIELAFPDDPQHYDDAVAFEPTNLEPRGSDGERPANPPRFEVVAVLASGGWRSFLLRGFDPGAEGFTELEIAIEAAGFVIERISAEGRSARDPRTDDADTDHTVPTLAALVGASSEHDLTALRRVLQTATAGWPLPLLCPDLDRAVGDDAEAARSREFLERWNP